MTNGKTRKRTHHDIVLSSTFNDLIQHRKAVIDAILKFGLFPQAMELDSARPEDLIDSSLSMVRTAKAYVGVIGHRYGQVPECPIRNPKSLSLTELEYEEAKKLRLPIYLFLMSKKHPVEMGDIESSAGDAERRKAFCERVKNHIYAEFQSVDELRSKVTESLVNLREQLDATEKITPAAVINAPNFVTAPALFAMPPYAPGHKFTGRARELQLLSDWAVAPNEPVLVLEAIGGMGKSMICWEWVNRHARKIRTEFTGIFWYSFYERGADMRDFCAYALAYLSGQPVVGFKEKKTAALADSLGPLLRQKPWLLVLDGLERVLVAYNRHDAAQVRDEEIENTENPAAQKKSTDCIRPTDSDLLRMLTDANPSKFLISSRIMPSVFLNNSGLERPGVTHKSLTGLDPSDAESMLRDIGVTGDPARMRHYLDTNFGCHSLVVGVVGGLIRNYPPAPCDFNRWVEDSAGGASINVAEMNLVQRRNHILKAAFEDLEPDEGVLLSRIALVFEAVDYKTLVELNPRRPEAPEAVIPPSEQLRTSEYLLPIYERQMAKYKKYVKELDAWRRSPELSQAERWLRNSLQNLDSRGLLQWDRENRRYDLHPVVRGYAVSSILPDKRENIAQKVIDYFSSQSQQPEEEVTSLNDLRNSFQVARALLYIGGKAEQSAAVIQNMSNAMFWNLEAFIEFLTLVRPLFPDGWDQPASGVTGKALSHLWTDVAIALHSSGRAADAIKVYESVISYDIDIDNIKSLLVDINNLSVQYRDTQRYCSLARLNDLSSRAMLLSSQDSDIVSLYLRRLNASVLSGNFTDAENWWSKFESVPHPASRRNYRAGDGEYWLGRLRFHQGRLDEALLVNLENLARQAHNRPRLRDLHLLRGEWYLSNGLWAEAAAAFEEHIRMSREVNLSSVSSEARLALVQAKLGQTNLARENAERLRMVNDLPDLELAELYVELGEHAKARERIFPAYKNAWADGPPYADWWELERCRAVLQVLGDSEPNLPPFDPSKIKPFSFEAKLLAYLEEKKKENEDRKRRKKEEEQQDEQDADNN